MVTHNLEMKGPDYFLTNWNFLMEKEVMYTVLKIKHYRYV